MRKLIAGVIALVIIASLGGSCLALVRDVPEIIQTFEDAQEAARAVQGFPTPVAASQPPADDIDVGTPRENAQRTAEGWSILHFNAAYRVRDDGVIDVTEDIAVDFFELQKHGIFRDLLDRIPCGEPIAGAQQPIHECPTSHDRIYRYKVVAVTDFSGNPHKYAVEDAEGTGIEATRIRIGDADVFVSGEQEYRIHYTVDGALDAYDDHDELYWDVTGNLWGVVMEAVNITVELPPEAELEVVCYQGAGSSAQCRSAAAGNTVTYAATREMFPGEEVTIVAGWQKGVVDVPPPILRDRPSIDDYFELDALEFGTAGVLGVLGIGAVIALWWRHGRDRRYTSIYYLTDDPASETRPLFDDDNVVVEYLPPNDLRPAQMGLILDERADTLDVTASIIDLAVRGYIHITEIPKKGWFGSADWTLKKLKDADDQLLKYERTLLNGLFATADEVDMSDLKDKFYTKLGQVKDHVYDDGMKQSWFPVRPGTAKGAWLAAGFGIMALGAVISVASGWFWGRGLLGAGIILAGIVMLVLSQGMSRRTPTGSEALRRVLGFRLYVATAETRIQDFNEQQNILNNFAKYLPYAIVFGCVDKWANAFKDLENEAAASTAGWYSGSSGAFHVAAFSSGLHSFSSSVSSTLASSPSSSGSGGSGGGGGGSSGGGGGGGGGGSW